jgi:chromosome segregation ATPase
MIVNFEDSTLSSTSHLVTRSPPLSTRADPEETLQDCLGRLKELVERCSKLVIFLSEHRKTKEKEINNLEDSLAQLTKEKEEISGFLRNALASKQELSSLSQNGTKEPAVISMVSLIFYA